VIDARDKLTGLIRHAMENEAGLELAASPGRPTPRGRYDTTWMFAQNGTDTFLTIEATWYPRNASFTLTGPAVERAEDAFWADRGLIRSRQGAGRGPLQCRLLVPYAGGDRVDLLVAALPALLAGHRTEPIAPDVEATHGRVQGSPVESLPGAAPPDRPSVTLQSTPGEAPGEDESGAPALAARVEAAAQSLRDAVGAGPLSSESAAAVACHLQAALDHIAVTLWPSVSDALPHAARHLDVAATRIGLTADLISSAAPVIAATAGRTADFPTEGKPIAPPQGGVNPSPSAALRPQPPKPAKSGRAR
jgi:hypothetical protein